MFRLSVLMELRLTVSISSSLINTLIETLENRLIDHHCWYSISFTNVIFTFFSCDKNVFTLKTVSTLRDWSPRVNWKSSWYFVQINTKKIFVFLWYLCNWYLTSHSALVNRIAIFSIKLSFSQTCFTQLIIVIISFWSSECGSLLSVMSLLFDMYNIVSPQLNYTTEVEYMRNIVHFSSIE